MSQYNYRHPPTTIDSQISHNKMMYHIFLQECKQEIQISVPSSNLIKYWHSYQKVHVNTSNRPTLCHWSNYASIYPTMWISSTKTTLCKIFSSTISLGSFLAYLSSTDHVQKNLCKKTPCVTCNLPPNPHVVEWHQVTAICAYVADGRVMVHSTSHHEHLGKPRALLVAPTRKIPSPNFHSHLMRLKLWVELWTISMQCLSTQIMVASSS